MEDTYDRRIDNLLGKIERRELITDYEYYQRRDIFGELLKNGDIVVMLATGMKVVDKKTMINYDAERLKIIDIKPDGMGLEIELENISGQKQFTPFFNVVKLIFKEEKKINTYYEVRLEFRLIKREEGTGNFISAKEVNIPGEPVLFESTDIFTAQNFIDKVQHIQR